MHCALRIPEIPLLIVEQIVGNESLWLSRSTNNTLMSLGLSSKIFLAATMGRLWCHLPSLKFLIKTFPPDLWEDLVFEDEVDRPVRDFTTNTFNTEKQIRQWEQLRFIREINEDDWIRFDLYAHRVRGLTIDNTAWYNDGFPIIQSSVFQQMCESRPAQRWLLNLERIFWHPGASADWPIAHLFINSNFKYLDFHDFTESREMYRPGNEMVLEKVLNKIISAECKMKQLDLSFFNFDAHGNLLSGCLKDAPLVSFGVDSELLHNKAILLELFKKSRLEHLECLLAPSSIEVLQSMERHNALLFPRLTGLSLLKGTQLPVATQFIRAISGTLQVLKIETDRKVLLLDLKEFLLAVIPHVSSLRQIDFEAKIMDQSSIQDEFIADNMRASLYELISSSKMRSFRFYNLPKDLMENMKWHVEKIAQVASDAQQIILVGNRRPQNSLEFSTVMQLCSRLARLTKLFIGPISTIKILEDLQSSPNFCLKELILINSSISDVQNFASYIRQKFPHIEYIGKGDRNLNKWEEARKLIFPPKGLKFLKSCYGQATIAIYRDQDL